MRGRDGEEDRCGSGCHWARRPACAGLFPPEDGTLNSGVGTGTGDGTLDDGLGFEDELFGAPAGFGGPGATAGKANAGEAGGPGIPGGGGGGAAGAGAAGAAGAAGYGKPNLDGRVRYGGGGGGSAAGGRGYVSSKASRGRGAGGRTLGGKFNLKDYLPGKGKAKGKLGKRIGARGLAGKSTIGGVSGNIWMDVSNRYKAMCGRKLLYDCKGN